MKAFRSWRANKKVATAQRDFDAVVKRKPTKPASEDPYANRQWERDVEVARQNLTLNKLNASQFQGETPITPENFKLAEENIQKNIQDINVSFVDFATRRPTLQADAAIIDANMNPQARNLAKTADGVYKQLDNAVKDSRQTRGDKATDSLMEQKLGKDRWATIKDVLKVSAVVGGSIGGIVLLMKAIQNRKSGCFMTDPTSGRKKCNADPDNPSCDGCTNEQDPTCRGQGGKCGTCQCASEGVSCSCVDMSFGDAIESFVGDAWDAATAIAGGGLDFLQFFQKYFAYFVIGIAAFGVLYFMKMIFAAPDSRIQLKK
jgi:hypothetical protein